MLTNYAQFQQEQLLEQFLIEFNFTQPGQAPGTGGIPATQPADAADAQITGQLRTYVDRFKNLLPKLKNQMKRRELLGEIMQAFRMSRQRIGQVASTTHRKFGLQTQAPSQTTYGQAA